MPTTPSKAADTTEVDARVRPVRVPADVTLASSRF